MTTISAIFSFNKYPIAMVFMAFILAACGGGDTVNVDTPTYLKSLTVTADAPVPTLLGPGDYTIQFRAMVNYSDGTQRDASGLATWVSSDDALMTIDKNGLGHFNFKDNSVTIWAAFTTAFDSVIFTILPPDPKAPAGSLNYDIKSNSSA